MKVAIVAFANIKFSPYIFPYVDVLKKLNVQIELIYLNRMDIKEEFPDGILREIKWDNTKSKAINFLSFRRQASKMLKKGKYDFVISLTTFPSVLLTAVLNSHYRGKYLVDVRDYTYEDNSLYYHLEKKVLKNAALRVISSPGFKNFLPENEYCVCHNVASSYSNGCKEFSRKENGKIIIGYVGSIGYTTNCKMLIDLVKNDDRFCFYFYGNENSPMPVTNYAQNSNCDRIKCFGEYSPSQKGKIIESIDIMFNVYGNRTPLVQYALSNKLYDSMYFKKPLLVSPDTDMQRQTREFSYAVDLQSVQNLDGLYEWYMNIDGEKMNSYMEEKLSQFKNENQFFEDTVRKVIEGGQI